MRYATVCSGIEAPSVALGPLGWDPVFFSEIEAFPRAVLTHRHRAECVRRPLGGGVPMFADFTAIRVRHLRRLGIPLPDALIAGTPCQSFSVAGMRKSLDDARGNLTLEFVRLANALRNANKSFRWIVWENVPGVLSTGDNAFGCLLAGLVGADAPLVSPLERGRWPDAGMVGGPRARAAWRILDAQYFGLAQRRRRVLLVVGFGEGADPAAVLFERESVRGNPAPRREAGEGVAALTANGVGTCGADDNQGQAGHLIAADMAAPVTTVPHADNEAQDSKLVVMAHGQANAEISEDDISPSLTCNHEAQIIAHSLRAEGFDASEDGTGRGTPIVPVAILEAGKRCGAKGDKRDGLGVGQPGDPMFTLQSGAQHAVAFHTRQDPITAEDVALPVEATTPCNAVAFHQNQRGEVRTTETAGALSSGGGKPGQGYPAVAVNLRGREGGATAEISGEVATALRASQGGGDKQHLLADMAVRRLTPRECERLQGFPDDYTLIPGRGYPKEDYDEMIRYFMESHNPPYTEEEAKEAAKHPDGPRYKAIGNSKATKVVRWLGERIDAVEGTL